MGSRIILLSSKINWKLFLDTPEEDSPLKWACMDRIALYLVENCLSMQIIEMRIEQDKDLLLIYNDYPNDVADLADELPNGVDLIDAPLDGADDLQKATDEMDL